MRLQSYASDVLEDAMTLAQTKALNSFSFRDCLNTLTELWGYCYEKISLIDDGFYSTTIRLTKELTVIPPYVKNTIKVYTSQDPVGYGRLVYREAGQRDMVSPRTFHISGTDLYCKDAATIPVWLNYTPEPPFVTFTKNNRDPKILTTAPPPSGNNRYGQFMRQAPSYIFKSMVDSTVTVDTTELFEKPGYQIVAFILDHPYVFISYQDAATGDYSSYIMKNIFGRVEVIPYNPFDYQGRGSRVKFLSARYNDYTGMGVVLEDQADSQIKELGWTPDTLLVYPSRIMYNYLVSSIAKRFSSLNNSMISGVEEMLAQSRYEMSNFLKKDKSGWGRIDNVTRPKPSDML